MPKKRFSQIRNFLTNFNKKSIKRIISLFPTYRLSCAV
jgi:hypothetical protein